MIWFAAVSAQAGELEDFLAGHFAGVPAANVHLAEGWGPLESALLPEKCGTCHPQQLVDWSGSRHSMATGPGLAGQLLDAPARFEVCNTCHAPLAEQRPLAGGAENLDSFREDLRDVGLGCASCHVRDGEMHGPPARPGRAEPGPGFPHGGYVQHDAFESVEFCGTCHQFPETGRRVAGVLLEDTVSEWAASPWGERAEPCQTCHMPDRRHLWRGIHDPAFTEEGLTITLASTGRTAAVYAVTSTAVGHRFPTYVTPRITLRIWAVNADGQVVASGEHVIQRRVPLSLAEQSFDTRLHPGESAVLPLEWRRKDHPVRVEAKLVVEPDEFYRRFFESYHSDNPDAQALIETARQDTVDSLYEIGVRSLDLSTQ